MKTTRLATVVALAVAVMALMSPAFAGRESGENPPKDRTYTNTPTPTVAPDVTERGPSDPGTDPAERPATLPLTGGGLVGFVVAGSLAIGGGTALLRRARGRETDR